MLIVQQGHSEDATTFTVPQVIAVHLAAEAAKGADPISRCFAQDGAVRDEGRDAIRHWKTAADAKYNYVLARSEFVRKETR